jgi:hypothetical protein
MKIKTVLVIIFIYVSAVTAESNNGLIPFIISEKVGDTIDSLEAEDYGIFKGLDGFISAKFWAFNETTFVCSIKTNSGKIITCHFSVDGFNALLVAMGEEPYLPHNIYTKGDFRIVAYDRIGFPINALELSKKMGCRYKNVCCCGAGAVSSSVSIIYGVPLIIGGIIGGVAMRSENDSSKDIQMGIIIGIPLINAIIGSWVGEKIDKRKALNKISEKRYGK